MILYFVATAKSSKVHCRINYIKGPVVRGKKYLDTNTYATKYCAEENLRRKIRRGNPFSPAVNILLKIQVSQGLLS